MTDSQRFSENDVIAVFGQFDDPTVPLSTCEVAEALGCPNQTAYDKLNSLAESNLIKTKKVGTHVRIWWQPQRDVVQDPDIELTDDLFGDEMLELELHSTEIALPFSEVTTDDFHVSTDGVVSLDDGIHLQYYTAKGIPTKTYIEISSQYPQVRDIRLLSSVDDTTKIEVQTEADSLTTVFRDHGGQFNSADIEGGIATLRGVVPITADINALLTELKELSSDISLVSKQAVATPLLFQLLVKDTLTNRQWTALRLAYFAGYFEQSRKSTGTELASRLGVTKQTYHHHLRKAEQTVFRYLFEGMESDEEL